MDLTCEILSYRANFRILYRPHHERRKKLRELNIMGYIERLFVIQKVRGDTCSCVSDSVRQSSFVLPPSVIITSRPTLRENLMYVVQNHMYSSFQKEWHKFFAISNNARIIR